jgi:hypothetical protein
MGHDVQLIAQTDIIEVIIEDIRGHDAIHQTGRAGFPHNLVNDIGMSGRAPRECLSRETKQKNDDRPDRKSFFHVPSFSFVLFI